MPTDENKKKILVIDDEPQILYLVGRFLQRLGYDVQTAEGGEVALQRLKSMPFALVLSDLRMPGVDGLRRGSERLYWAPLYAA